ncbi:MAG: WD40 repeat domain-containing protein [Bacteroidota bacterium]
MSKIQVTKLHTLTGHRDCIYSLQQADAGHLIFSGGGDGMVALWDLRQPDTGQLVAQLPNSIYAMHYHASTDTLVVGHNYDGIHWLDWKNKKEIGSLQITKSSIFDIQSFDGRLLVASGDGDLTLVDAVSRNIINRVHTSEKSARTIAINDKTGELAVGYSDDFIRVFDEKLNEKATWKAHDKSIFTLRYSPDGKRLLSGARDARLKVWNVAAGYEQAEEIVAHLYAINHLDFSPDGKHFVTCSMDKSIKVWDMAELKLLKVIDKARHAGHGTSVNKLLWTPYQDQLVSASDDRTLSVWHIIF